MDIQTDYYTIKPYANLLEISTFLSWDEKIVTKHIEDVRKITSRLYQNKPWGLLSNRVQWQLGTPQAERLFAENAKTALTDTLTHIAIWVGGSELKKWQIRHMIKNFAGYEINFFESLSDAESWLASVGYTKAPLAADLPLP